MVLEASDTIVSQEVIEQTREEMGLNDPFFVQIWQLAFRCSTRRYGNFLFREKPVIDKLMEGFMGTVLLALTTIILIMIISIPLGIFLLHIAIEFLTFSENLFFIGVSMPSFG